MPKPKNRNHMPYSQMTERQRKSFIYRILKPLVKSAGWTNKTSSSDMAPPPAKHCHISYSSTFSFIYRHRAVPFVCPDGKLVNMPCQLASWGRHTGAGTCKKHRCPGRQIHESICLNFDYKTETMRLGDVMLPIGDPKLPSFLKALLDLKVWPERVEHDDVVEIKSLIDVDTLEDAPWDVTKHEWVNIAKTKMPKTPAGLVLRTIQQNLNMQGALNSDYDKKDPNNWGNTFLRLNDDRLPCSVMFEFSEEGRMLIRLGGKYARVWLALGEKCDPRSPEWPIEMFIEKGTKVINMMMNLGDYI